MRPSEQKFWPVLTFVLLGCSAVTDFGPVPRQENRSGAQPDEGGTPGFDAGNAAGLDAAADVDAANFDSGAPEAGPSCQLDTHAGCGAEQLCCDRSDGIGARCLDTLGARECGACGQACSDPAAPHCGAGRVCECEPGTGKACAAGKRCLGSGASARCAECETDDDCATNSASKQCVLNRCVQCDRGALTGEASDDQGCNEAGKPICNESNTCVACTSNPDDCPGDQVCNGSLGCFGCNLLTPLDTRNCGGTRPICRAGASGQPQCDACRSNNECGSGYCDSRPGVGTGACTNVCAPAGELGMNGCSAPTPFCKQVAGNEFACRGCVAADCSGATPFCATEAGSRRGSCVACRNNADCGQSSGTPICDASSGSCRPRQASDCPAGSVFDPPTMTCLDCVGNTDCADTPATPLCVRNRCVQCQLDSECTSAGAPLCSPANNRCVACTMLGNNAAADAQCAADQPGTLCARRGNRSGQCAVCEPQNNRGCAAPTPFCFAANNNSPLACHECDPGDNMQTCASGSCQLVGGIRRCVPPDAGMPADAATL
jgi:hypothetical protein